MSPARVELAAEVPEGSLPLTAEELVRQAERVLELSGLEGRLSLAVVGDDAMRAVNRDFHDTDAPTDVLAFALGPDGEGDPSGFTFEVVVSLDTAVREASRREVDPAAELLLYITHGLLHLAGEDDHEPAAARRMHLRTLGILEELGHRNTIALPHVPDPEPIQGPTQ